MNVLVSATFIILAICVTSQQQCNGIYSDDFLQIDALDVCSNNTLLGFLMCNKYECQDNDQVYNSYFYYNTNCNGSPDSSPRINSNGMKCDGITDCPYSMVRIYEYNNNCEDFGIWRDAAYIVNVCQSSNDTSINATSGILECDPNIGITRKLYADDNCQGEIVEETVEIPGNQTCFKNIDDINIKFLSCNQRMDVSSTSTPTETAAAAQRVDDKEDKQRIDIKNGDVMEVYGIAEFIGNVKGEVVIDENGNIEINIDVSSLDDVLCDNKEYLYGIYNAWSYDEKEDKYGDDCNYGMIANYMDPFETGRNCDELGDGEDIDFFNCAVGDLSGRFGVVKPDENGKISIEHNMSYSSKSGKNDGFCGLRLNPMTVYGKSVMFRCNDNAETVLFCAPFTVKVYDDERE